MSSPEDSDSDSSSSEDLSTTGLIATRAKRATAGNLYATLRANLDDEDIRRDLLAEDDEADAGEYEGSDKDGDDDDALESSSEDEDAGPPKEGEAEDLEGEKDLKRQERVEARKKRKVQDARIKVPAWRQKKRVKLADDVKTEDGGSGVGSGVEKPKKKSERSNWLPTPADAPVRQSGRSLAVANREIVHANLKQSAERSEKQRRVMKDAAERERTKRRMEGMTQEERLKKCERIERETAREFGRWEREEAERQRVREEAIAAKRRRGLDGPVVRHWSGSVLWEGERIKIRRMSHGSKRVEEIKDEKKDDGDGKESASGSASKAESEKQPATATSSAVDQQTGTNIAGPSGTEAAATNPAPSQPPVPWLQGIHEYAAQPVQNPPVPAVPPYTPSAPAINGEMTPSSLQPPTQTPQQPLQQWLPPLPTPSQQPVYPSWPPGSHQFSVQPQSLPPPPPPAPLIREQAQRSLLLLESFPSLDNTTSKKVPKYKLQQESALDPTPVTNILLPLSHPSFNTEEQRYLISRPRKRMNEYPLPPPPPKQRCAVTSWTAKFRDPKTGLAYADMHQYKVIQRVLAGGCAWSGMLGCWVGPNTVGMMGRPARGVPDGFAGPKAVKAET
jgi:vacuolar protein sorting-associated protein 72